jgi:hypothetical protein
MFILLPLFHIVLSVLTVQSLFYIVLFPVTAEDWKAVNEDLTVSCRYAIKNQTTGDRLLVRVVAVNSGGRSPPATIADPILVKEVGGKQSMDNTVHSRNIQTP